MEMSVRARIEAIIDILKVKGLIDEDDQKRPEVVSHSMFEKFNQ